MKLFGYCILAVVALMGIAALLGYTDADHDEREEQDDFHHRA